MNLQINDKEYSKMLDAITKRIFNGSATHSDAKILFELSKEGLDAAGFLYGLYILLILKDEANALAWIKSDKTKTMHISR